MIIKYKKSFLILLIFIMLFFPIFHIFASDEEDYGILYEKCINRQNELSEAIERYLRENNEIKNIKIVSEEDYESLIEILFGKKYINNRATGTENECSYRYNSDDHEIYCIKHGNNKFVADCLKRYKKKKEFENLRTKINFIFGLIGFGVIFYSIIL